MAQIIKLRRGTLAELNGVTLNNGEIGVVTSSVASIGDAVLKSGLVVGNTDGTNRLSIARIITGNATPDLSGVTGGSAFNDMLYHETDAKALKVLNTGGNTTLDLGANISVSEIAGNVSGSSTSTGSFGYLYVSGDATIGGNITFGDANTDFVSFGADIDSNLIPNSDDTYDLGSASQAWQDLFLEGDITLTDAGSLATTAGALTLTSAAAATWSTSAGALVIDGAGGLTLDSDGTDAVNLGTEAVAKTITIGNAASTKVDINALALDFDSAAATDILAASTVSVKGATGASFGDDTGTWEFNGSGAVSETGMTTFSLTPSSTVDIDSGGTITIDGPEVYIGNDGDTGDISLSSTSFINITANAASTWKTSTGTLLIENEASTITLDGATGVTLKEGGSNVIAIDTNRDVLFSQTGGSVSDPDVEIDGYFKVDGQTTFTAPISASSDISGSVSSTGSFGRINTAGSIYASGRIYEAGTSVVDHATAMAIVFGG